MIIVSQDKERVINFNKVDYLGVYREENGAYIGVNFSNPYGDFLGIGRYKTEERAKEVLKEIARYYRIFKGMETCNKDVQAIIVGQLEKEGKDLYTYTMPED